MGSIARVKIKSSLERKVKQGQKRHFLVRKWTNNTVNSNSVRHHMHHLKKSPLLSSFGLRGVFAKGF